MCVVDCTLVQFIGFAIVLAGALAASASGAYWLSLRKDAKEKKAAKKLKIAVIAGLALFVLGWFLLGDCAQGNSAEALACELGFGKILFGPGACESCVQPGDEVPGLRPGAVGGDVYVLDNQTEVYSKRLTPITCDAGAGNLQVWRELVVYEGIKTLPDGSTAKTYYSTVTLHLKNDGDKDLMNLIIKEHLPEAVATTPEELFNFTVKPIGFEKGSVVVKWAFDNIRRGEEKTVSYTVEKKLDEKVLDEYKPPEVISNAAAQGGGATVRATDAPQQESGGFDFTLIGLVVAIVLVGGVIFFFTRKAQA